MDRPSVLAFHLGEPGGSAWRIVWDGRVVRFSRLREGVEPLREAVYVPDDAAWARFRRAVDKLSPGAWAPRYGGEPDGAAWSLELAWADLSVRASGAGAYPEGFAGFKRAIWGLLGDPPAI